MGVSKKVSNRDSILAIVRFGIARVGKLLMKSSNKCFGVKLTFRCWCKGWMIDGGFVVVCFRPIGLV